MARTDIPPSDVVTVEFDGHVATVWLDRPDKRNAFAPEFWEDFPRIMETLGDDDETRVVVIAARGTSFTAGIDLMAFAPMFTSGGVDPTDPSPPSSDVGRRKALYRSVKRLQRAFTSVAECPKPVIAAVHGHCIGAGVDLITACDLRFASTDAIFSVRETKLAMVADVGTLQRLPRIVNPGYVADVVFTGRDFDAAEAHEMGLVTRVLPDAATLHRTAAEVAAQIAANSPLAVQGAKAVLAAEADMPVDAALDHIALWNAAFIQSNDLVEAVTAFMEKRPPEFTGE